MGQVPADRPDSGPAPYGFVGDGRLSRHWRHYFTSLGIPWKLWSRRMARANGKPGVSSPTAPLDALAACFDIEIYTSPIGSFVGNGFGLHDMFGNVWEWTADCYVDHYVGAPADGSAWLDGDCERPAIRGGGWSSGPMGLRAAYRNRVLATDRSSIIGLRAALSLTP